MAGRARLFDISLQVEVPRYGMKGWCITMALRSAPFELHFLQRLADLRFMTRNLVSSVILLAASTLGAYSLTLGQDLAAPELWKPERVPFSFKYAGKDSAQLLARLQSAHQVVTGKKGPVQTYAYTDPATHLQVTAELQLYPDFPGVADWVLIFRNKGAYDTPIIEDILPLHWTPFRPRQATVFCATRRAALQLLKISRL